jgi:beta-mannosidase
MTAGIWRPLRLDIYSSRVADLWSEVNVDQSLKTASGTLNARIEGASDKVKFTMRLRGETIFEQDVSISDDGLAMAKVNINNPELWFPHGYGPQNLYEVSVSIYSGEYVLDTASKRIGLRRGELVQDDDKIGRSFYFRINNVDIFCAGSCWIPADNFIPRIGADKYRKWLQTMIDGNQVMTRYETKKI